MVQLSELDLSIPVAIDCIDDRGLMNTGQNIKIGAGAYGLAQDLHAARSTGSLEVGHESIPTLGETAKIITAYVGRYALFASVHEACAAEAGIVSVGQTIIERPSEVLQRANAIMQGDISTNQYEQVAEAYQRMLFDPATRVFRSTETEAACMDRSMKHRAITRKLLANELHMGGELQANHVKNTWFAAAAAYEAGESAYHVDQWVVPVLAETIDEVLPHDNVDGFVIASSIRHAATSLLLPYKGDCENPGLDIQVITR